MWHFSGVSLLRVAASVAWRAVIIVTRLVLNSVLRTIPSAFTVLIRTQWPIAIKFNAICRGRLSDGTLDTTLQERTIPNREHWVDLLRLKQQRTNSKISKPSTTYPGSVEWQKYPLHEGKGRPTWSTWSSRWRLPGPRALIGRCRPAFCLLFLEIRTRQKRRAWGLSGKDKKKTSRFGVPDSFLGGEEGTLSRRNLCPSYSPQHTPPRPCSRKKEPGPETWWLSILSTNCSKVVYPYIGAPPVDTAETRIWRYFSWSAFVTKAHM